MHSGVAWVLVYVYLSEAAPLVDILSDSLTASASYLTQHHMGGGFFRYVFDFESSGWRQGVDTCADVKDGPGDGRHACVNRQLGTLWSLARYRSSLGVVPLGVDNVIQDAILAILNKSADGIGIWYHEMNGDAAVVTDNESTVNPIWTGYVLCMLLEYRNFTGVNHFDTQIEKLEQGVAGMVAKGPNIQFGYHGLSMIWSVLATVARFTSRSDVRQTADAWDVAMGKLARPPKGPAFSFFALRAAAERMASGAAVRDTLMYFVDIYFEEVLEQHLANDAEGPYLKSSEGSNIGRTKLRVPKQYGCGLPLEGLAYAIAQLKGKGATPKEQLDLKTNFVLEYIQKDIAWYQVGGKSRPRPKVYKKYNVAVHESAANVEIKGGWYRDLKQMRGESRIGIRPDDVSHCMEALLGSLQLASVSHSTQYKAEL